MSEKCEKKRKTEYILEPKLHCKHTSHEKWETNEWNNRVLSIYETITINT